MGEERFSLSYSWRPHINIVLHEIRFKLMNRKVFFHSWGIEHTADNGRLRLCASKKRLEMFWLPGAA